MQNWILALAWAAYVLMAAPPEPSHNPPAEHAVLMQTPQEVAPTVAISPCVDASTHEMGETAVALFMAYPTSGVLMNGPLDQVAEPADTWATIITVRT